MFEQFNNICEFRQANPVIRGEGLLVNDPSLLPVKKDLEILKNSLKNEFENYRDFRFEFESAKGQTYFPSILHVSILPPKQAVSKGIYVVICFDILGRGALVGCAESVTHPQGLNTVKRKKRNIKLQIDVDGLRDTTRYNDAFENPLELLYPIENDFILINHIRKSLDLALYHLHLIDSSNLTIADRVGADLTNSRFDPSDLNDAREKIARQITARRGQKKFRASLLKAYDTKCAVTGSTVESVLEAAHIIPYKGDNTNHIQNGILLRSDIHLLFDLGQLTIDAETKHVKVHRKLYGTYYEQYNNRLITLPVNTQDHPHFDALKYHNDIEFKE